MSRRVLLQPVPRPHAVVMSPGEDAVNQTLPRPRSPAARVQAGIAQRVPTAVLAAAERISVAGGAPLNTVLIARGALSPLRYARLLGEALHMPAAVAVRLARLRPMPSPHRLLAAELLVPLADGQSVLAADALSPATAGRVLLGLGAERLRVSLVTRAQLVQAISATYGETLLRAAIGQLRARQPHFSAAHGPALWQMVALVALAGAAAGAACIAPRATLDLVARGLSLIFFATVVLRLAALPFGCIRREGSPPQTRDMNMELPRYSVLVPLYREAAVLTGLLGALRALDYPADRLDIKLVLEAGDTETRAALRGMRLPGSFDIIVVPPGGPKTKPKALNFALPFVCGEFVVIYDAEDRPESDQLLKAAAAFARAGPETACFQARLEFDNARENWLAAQLALEYLSLFGGVLPLYDHFALPMPLGGTSNHFRTETLRAVGGWDPFNVTEDADLGLRLARCGYRCRMLASTTWEEAACQPGNWLRQRTRWLKGWLQTYGVHMRRPLQLTREIGIGGMLAVQAHFAGMIISGLVHPFGWAIIGWDAAHGQLFAPAGGLAAQSLATLALVNMTAGYCGAAALAAAVCIARRQWHLVPHLALIPFYWMLLSVAAWRAVFQLCTRPHHWEKTTHGLSRSRAEFPANQL